MRAQHLAQPCTQHRWPSPARSWVPGQSVLQSEGTWTAWGTRLCWPAGVLFTLENPLVAVETCSLLTQFRRNPNL